MGQLLRFDNSCYRIRITPHSHYDLKLTVSQGPINMLLMSVLGVSCIKNSRLHIFFILMSRAKTPQSVWHYGLKVSVLVETYMSRPLLFNRGLHFHICNVSRYQCSQLQTVCITWDRHTRLLMRGRGTYSTVLTNISAHSYRQFILREADTPDRQWHIFEWASQ